MASVLCHRGQVVQTRRFKPQNVIGNAITAVDFFNSWAVDEIILLDISPNDQYFDSFVETADELSKRCFVPLTVGGNVRSLDAARRLTRVGADKVVVNTGAFLRPELIAEIADAFGKQAVVVSVDAAPNPDLPSGYEVVIDRARHRTKEDLLSWVNKATAHGAGELLLNSVEHDGDRRGYDIPLMNLVTSHVSIPVIAFGGVNEWQDLVSGIRDGGVQAVAAGNIFHYTEQSTKKAKEFLEQAQLRVRRSQFYEISLPRHPKYRPY
ncbi:MAG: imidazole glycerol phosphate synthase subunit HisF [Alphaproteobacteria bacterium]|nr:imidazole glycerol phosphate synthase subunit HisF [Alphaproteobacteria bacterium]